MDYCGNLNWALCHASRRAWSMLNSVGVMHHAGGPTLAPQIYLFFRKIHGLWRTASKKVLHTEQSSDISPVGIPDCNDQSCSEGWLSRILRIVNFVKCITHSFTYRFAFNFVFLDPLNQYPNPLAPKYRLSTSISNQNMICESGSINVVCLYVRNWFCG